MSQGLRNTAERKCPSSTRINDSLNMGLKKQMVVISFRKINVVTNESEKLSVKHYPVRRLQKHPSVEYVFTFFSLWYLNFGHIIIRLYSIISTFSIHLSKVYKTIMTKV